MQALTSQQRYLPFGEERAIPNSPILATSFTYTGQRLLDSGMGGIMDYKARFYSPALGRFIQPDTIIPDQTSPQSWNRFSYVMNNPVRFNDPTGHMLDEGDGGGCYPCTQLPPTPNPDDSGENGEGGGDNECSQSDIQCRLDANPEETIKYLDNCFQNILASNCAPVLDLLPTTEEECNAPILIPTGGNPIRTGCYIAGYHYEFQLSQANGVQLIVDLISIVGSIAPAVGLIGWGLPGLAVGEAMNIVAQFVSIGYNLHTQNNSGLTWDLVQTIVPEIINGGSIVPIVGAGVSAQSAFDIITGSIVRVPEKKPLYPWIALTP